MMRRSLVVLVFMAAQCACAITQAANLQVVVVAREGKPVADAVVVLRTAVASQPSKSLPAQITISQEKMRFVTVISIVALGARAHFVNNDPWEHRVRGSAAGAAQFDQKVADGFEFRLDGMPDGKAAKTADAVLSKAGAVLLGCHLHVSMRGHIFVSESPWATISDANGSALFDGAPEGSARIQVWHPEQFVDVPVQTVRLSGTPSVVTVALGIVPRRRRN